MKNKEVETLVKLLTEKGWHIVTMESCTGGALANAITNVPGASAVIKDSFITYSNEAKIKLGVLPQLIKKYTVYSGEVAGSMACCAARASVMAKHKIIGVGITGSLTREDPNNPNSVPGKVYIALDMYTKGVNNGGIGFEYEMNVESTNRSAGKTEIVNEVTKILTRLVK